MIHELSYLFEMTRPMLTMKWMLFCLTPRLCSLGAEVLDKYNVKVTPFLSKYRMPAIVVIVLLLLIELLCIIFQNVFHTSDSQILVDDATAIIYTIVAFVIAVCYVVASLQVIIRVRAFAPNNISSKDDPVRVMTLRTGLSVIGYIITISSTIAFAVGSDSPWGRLIPLNTGFVGVNFTSIMQVIAIRPTKKHHFRSEHAYSTQPTSPGSHYTRQTTTEA